ncbi:MAG: serine hydrolase [Fimbriiglobus sp.]|jgi:CubicO group peptidase (beta-lactamase class C family)|nr:serine hydrolase [Fimbriiglobus sp.]
MRGRGVLVGLVTLATALGVFAAPPDPVVEELAEACEAARRFWEVPGLAVVVVRKGEVIHLQGYGSRRLGTNGTKDEPVSPDTLFPLASCTKAFTSAAIAALVDDGQMDWDDPVRRHLPTFRLSDETANKLVSIRDLLCHRSGVGGHDLLWYRAPWDLDESVRRIAEVPLSNPFRGGYQYSSVTVSAAGLAAANRSRGGWDELLRDKLLTPLGMTAFAFTTKDAKGFPNRAGGYQGGDGSVGVVPMPEYEMAEPNPAGSLFVTPRDYARWLNFQLNDGKAGERQVVSAKQLSETKQPHTPIRLDGSLKGQHPGVTQMTYAMGWVVYDHRGERVIGHGGLIDGFRVLTVLLPERQAGFAIFANRHQTKLNLALGNTLADHLIGVAEKHRTNWNNEFHKIDQQETADKKAEREARAKARQPNQRPTRPDDQLAGVYFSPAYGEATLVLGKQPEWRVSTFRFPLEHWEGNAYRLTAGLFQDDLLEVVDDKNGLALLFRGMQFRRK